MKIGHIRAMQFDTEVRFDTLITLPQSPKAARTYRRLSPQKHTGVSNMCEIPTPQNEADTRKAIGTLMSEVDDAYQQGFVKAPPMLPQCADQMPDSVAQMITKVAREFGLEASND